MSDYQYVDDNGIVTTFELDHTTIELFIFHPDDELGERKAILGVEEMLNLANSLAKTAAEASRRAGWGEGFATAVDAQKDGD